MKYLEQQKAEGFPSSLPQIESTALSSEESKEVQTADNEAKSSSSYVPQAAQERQTLATTEPPHEAPSVSSEEILSESTSKAVTTEESSSQSVEGEESKQESFKSKLSELASKWKTKFVLYI